MQRTTKTVHSLEWIFGKDILQTGVIGHRLNEYVLNLSIF